MGAKVHIHMHVADLARSRAFYERFFGVPPVKEKPGYVKFLPGLGPVNLALSEGQAPAEAAGTVGHLGIQVDSTEIVRAELARVKAAGLPVREEMGVDCCHANEDKFWVRDPDGVEWEVYHLNYDLEGDVAPRRRRAAQAAGVTGPGLAETGACCAQAPAAEGREGTATDAEASSASGEPAARIGPAAPEDLDAVLALLADAALPREGVAEQLRHFLVARVRGTIVGCVGLEHYGPSALLRSLAVTSPRRGRGLGRALATRILDQARERGVTAVFLLTETAPDFFAALGFKRIAREEADPAVRGSLEFRTLCCQSAVCMRRDL